MGKMSKFTLLRAAALIILHGSFRTREFKKHFRDEMAAGIHQLIMGIWGRIRDTFVLGNTPSVFSGHCIGSFLDRVNLPSAPKSAPKLHL